MADKDDGYKRRVARILMHPDVNSFNRMEKFLSVSESLTDEEYWYGLQFAYTGSDDTYYLKHEIRQAFHSKRPGKDLMMEEDELELMNNLPENLQVYRGMTELEYRNGEYGVSWTLKPSVAEFFAYEYIRNRHTSELPKLVVSALISRQNIFAYFNGRNEEEVILDTSRLHSVYPLDKIVDI